MNLPPLKIKPIPKGSSLYYARIFSSKSHYRALDMLCTFYQEMRSIVDNITEPQVAKLKLAWWTQEISRLYAHSPQHPLSIALMPIVKSYHLNEEDFQQIIAAMISVVEHHHFTQDQELFHFCEKLGGTLCGMFCQILAFGTTLSKEFTQNLGVAMQIMMTIRNFGKDFSKGKMYLPLQEDIFHPEINQEKLTAKLAEYANHARNYNKKALHALDKSHRSALMPILILDNIYLTLLDEIEQDGFQVLKQKYSLTPIRKYWISWRTRLF